MSGVVILTADKINVKRSFIKKLFNTITFYNYMFENGKSIKILRLPVEKDYITRSSGSKLIKRKLAFLINKVNTYLHKNKIQYVLGEEMFCKGTDVLKRNVYAAVADIIIKKYATDNNLALSNCCIAIYSPKYVKHIYHIMRSIASEARYIHLYTDDAAKYEKDLDNIYDEFGLAVSVSASDNKIEEKLIIAGDKLSADVVARKNAVIFDLNKNAHLSKTASVIDDVVFDVDTQLSEFFRLCSCACNASNVGFLLDSFYGQTGNYTDLKNALTHLNIRFSDYCIR